MSCRDPRWLELLCPAEQRHRLRDLGLEAEALVVRCRHWAERAAEAIADVESTMRECGSPDALLDLVAEATGVHRLYGAADDMIELASTLAGDAMAEDGRPGVAPRTSTVGDGHPDDH